MQTPPHICITVLDFSTKLGVLGGLAVNLMIELV